MMPQAGRGSPYEWEHRILLADRAYFQLDQVGQRAIKVKVKLVYGQLNGNNTVLIKFGAAYLFHQLASQRTMNTPQLCWWGCNW